MSELDDIMLTSVGDSVGLNDTSLPILYESANGTVPTNFGLGVLTDALSCIVTEERNGIFELEMTYPASGLHAEDILVRRVIKAKPNYTDLPQLFRIYKVTKALNGVFSVYAQHISYDLSGYLAAVGSANGAQSAVAYLSAGTPFDIRTSKTSSKVFKVSVPASVRSYLAGKEGSFLDVYGTAEFHYDNYTIDINTNRGANRGVQIRYGKNLTELVEDVGADNLYTGVKPYWARDSVVVEGGVASTGLSLDVPRVYALDCTNDFQEAPSAADLNAKATSYISSHVLAVPDANISLDFVQLSDVTERVDLCDTVSIYYEALGVSATAKCIKTRWDVLLGRYVGCEFGTPKVNIAQTIVQIERTADAAVETAVSRSTAAVNSATDLITGNSGGYVVLHKGADGKPYEILVMNTEDINTATKVWRWNNAGWGYSSSGYAGPYTLAATQNGAIVADFITAGTLNANVIKAGVISDLAGKNSINMETGDATFQGTVTGSEIVGSTLSSTSAPYKIDIGSGNVSFAYNNNPVGYIRGSYLTVSGQTVESLYIRAQKAMQLYADHGDIRIEALTYDGEYHAIYVVGNVNFSGGTVRFNNPIGIESGGSGQSEPQVIDQLFTISGNSEIISESLYRWGLMVTVYLGVKTTASIAVGADLCTLQMLSRYQSGGYAPPLRIPSTTFSGARAASAILAPDGSMTVRNVATTAIPSGTNFRFAFTYILAEEPF